MKLKAQNTIEVICLVSIVLVVVVAVFMYSRGGSSDLVNLSKINGIETSNIENSANSSGTVQNQPDKIVDIETAGALSGTIANMSKSELTNAMADKDLEDFKAVKTANDDSIFDVANALITELSLNIKHINNNSLNSDTKNKLIDVAIKAKEKLNGANSTVYTMYTAMLAEIID